MVMGTDVRAGYGYKKEKPYNSIIPYLRAKQAEREQEDYKEPKKHSIKRVTKAEEPEDTLDEYARARRKILAEE